MEEEEGVEGVEEMDQVMGGAGTVETKKQHMLLVQQPLWLLNQLRIMAVIQTNT